ncbi:hypothetical protein GDO81_029729 [Engystomops pustulosus]|uniref:Uncharacterized protein n=1 Tax=Engystomops pustulosus TaxID=76066 RepID=A0AAV6ZHJ1_ENGPU|nr:hypothetical protein GDO81_029729 [Engystomops pustulosus]
MVVSMLFELMMEPYTGPSRNIIMGCGAIILGLAARRCQLEKEQSQRHLRRRLWVHPLLQGRDSHGQFVQLFVELRRYKYIF